MVRWRIVRGDADSYLTVEARARVEIDRRLAACGWLRLVLVEGDSLRAHQLTESMSAAAPPSRSEIAHCAVRIAVASAR